MRIFKIQDLDGSSIRWGCIGWGSRVLNLSYIPKVSLDEWDSGDGWLLTGVKGTIPDANPSPLAGQEGMLAHRYSCQLMAGSQLFLSAHGWLKLHLELVCSQSTALCPGSSMPGLLARADRLLQPGHSWARQGLHLCPSKRRALSSGLLWDQALSAVPWPLCMEAPGCCSNVTHTPQEQILSSVLTFPWLSC